MNIEEFRTYCLSKKGATESFPFDETTLVFKVMGKMFALTDIADEFRINLKADPEQVVIMREHYDAVLPWQRCYLINSTLAINFLLLSFWDGGQPYRITGNQWQHPIACSSRDWR